MTVSTTRKTWDPYIILKARDLIKLLSRSVPFEQVCHVISCDDLMKCHVTCRLRECWKMRSTVTLSRYGHLSETKRGLFVAVDDSLDPAEPRSRSYLYSCYYHEVFRVCVCVCVQAIELLTQCYVLVQGNTVAGVGHFRGLKQLRKIVEDTMKNIHPIYNIKVNTQSDFSVKLKIYFSLLLTDSDDKARADEGPKIGSRVVGPFSAQFQKLQRPAKETKETEGEEEHAVPSSPAREQGL